MSSATGGSDPATLSPTEAFNALGNETRIEILRALGEADGPLSFTELRDQLGLRRGSEFNYHLDKLRGKFIDDTEDGLVLRRPGNRIVQAVLSVAVAEDVIMGPTMLNEECYHCGGSAFMVYNGNHVSVYCRVCLGNKALPTPELIRQSDSIDVGDEIGFLGGFELPPAGIRNRTADELIRTGTGWQNLERLATGIGTCPRCSAKIETAIRVCETHDTNTGICDNCDNRYAVIHHRACPNCKYHRTSQIGRLLLSKIELLDFMTDHGVNPVAPESPLEFMAILDSYEEEVISMDPFGGQFMYEIDGGRITLTVDECLAVVNAKRND